MKLFRTLPRSISEAAMHFGAMTKPWAALFSIAFAFRIYFARTFSSHALAFSGCPQSR